jgi:hypothetical protein
MPSFTIHDWNIRREWMFDEGPGAFVSSGAGIYLESRGSVQVSGVATLSVPFARYDRSTITDRGCGSTLWCHLARFSTGSVEPDRSVTVRGDSGPAVEMPQAPNSSFESSQRADSPPFQITRRSAVVRFPRSDNSQSLKSDRPMSSPTSEVDECEGCGSRPSKSMTMDCQIGGQALDPLDRVEVTVFWGTTQIHSP